MEENKEIWSMTWMAFSHDLNLKSYSRNTSHVYVYSQQRSLCDQAMVRVARFPVCSKSDRVTDFNEESIIAEVILTAHARLLINLYTQGSYTSIIVSAQVGLARGEASRK
jgi:hypothetical protein